LNFAANYWDWWPNLCFNRNQGIVYQCPSLLKYFIAPSIRPNSLQEKGNGRIERVYKPKLHPREEKRSYRTCLKDKNPFKIVFKSSQWMDKSKGMVYLKQTNEIYLRTLQEADAEELLQLRIRNRSFFQTFEPIRPELHFTYEQQKEEIIKGCEAAEQDQAYFLGIFLKENEQLIGRVAITGIVRGPLQSGNLGYYLDYEQNGKGYTSEAVSQMLEFAFNIIHLHRVQAGVMPKNNPSVRVLEKNGFRKEGLAFRYLNINGVWEDHFIFAITQEDYKMGFFV
jgi:[ribosomal protein S5]-alanine N-acetyltransferase